jgi:hypothetical protein
MPVVCGAHRCSAPIGSAFGGVACVFGPLSVTGGPTGCGVMAEWNAGWQGAVASRARLRRQSDGSHFADRSALTLNRDPRHCIPPVTAGRELRGAAYFCGPAAACTEKELRPTHEVAAAGCWPS